MADITKILENWHKMPGVTFNSSEAEQLYKERTQRIIEAIDLKQPDRVPIVPDAEFFPFLYAGVSLKDGMNNYDKTYEAWKKTLQDYKWDANLGPFAYSAKVFEILKFKQLKWPGHGLEDSASVYQFQEPNTTYEAMRADEYDWFLDDPSDFMLRKFLPNIFGALEPLKNLVPLRDVISWYKGIFEALAVIGSPEVASAFETLLKAAKEAGTWFTGVLGFAMELVQMGFPSLSFAVSHFPFDYISDYLRGTKGTSLDIYRNPDKLLAACEKVTPWMIETGIQAAQATGIPIVAIFIHKGPAGFMSDEHFRTFYWPSAKKLILGIIERDFIPYVYTEGDYTPRLEYLRDVPKGKVIYHIEKDLFKAKEILGDIACLTGGPPNSLLALGTPQKVEDYCKKVIDIVGADGGFIMDAEAPIIEAKPENMRAMTDVTMNYGVYKR